MIVDRLERLGEIARALGRAFGEASRVSMSALFFDWPGASVGAWELAVKGATRTCEDCRRDFIARQGWERLCYPCWKKIKALEAKPDQELLALQALVVDLKRRVRTENAEATALHKRSMRLAQRLLEKTDSELGMVTAAIRLLHPDKHMDSPEATRITAWLIELRARLKKAKEEAKETIGRKPPKPVPDDW